MTRITPKNETIAFEYDAVNQLLKKTLPGNLLTSYTYDAVGNLTGVTDPDSVLTMIYDLANRLTSVATAGSSNQPAVSLSYTYDKNGNRLTLVDPTATTSYVYDVLNRLTSLTSPSGATAYAFDALSRRTSVTLPNGTQTTYTYDVASQATNILHKIVSTSAQINKADYGYNDVGNRTSLTDRRGVQSFGYDPLDRLTSATHPLTLDQTFAYDPVGNRTSGGRLFNAGNQQTEDNTFLYAYDANGNQTKKTHKVSGEFTVYSYDAENRLTQVDVFAAGGTVPVATSSYRYDGLGRRIEKVGNGQTRRYVYDGEDILLEYDETNAILARYTHGPGIDEPIAMVRGGSNYFYHQDGLGSVTELTDGTGATAKAYAYDAYGNVLEQTGTVENPYAYTGREYDAETGLYYYRARYYDPRTGRFLQKDPLRFVNGPNLYAYTMNNPVNFSDALGLWRNPSDVYDEAMKKASNSPFPDPHNGLQDAYRHCLASCMLTRENSEFEAQILGWANEVRGDWSHNQEQGERQADERNNACGRRFGQTATSTQDCERSCGNATKNGLLQTYQRGTTPRYWDTRLGSLLP